MSIMRELREEFGLQSDRVQTKQYAARDQMFQQSAIYTIRYRTSKGTEEEVLKERWGVFLAKIEIITNDNDTEDSEDVANKQANMFSEYFQNCSKT